MWPLKASKTKMMRFTVASGLCGMLLILLQRRSMRYLAMKYKKIHSVDLSIVLGLKIYLTYFQEISLDFNDQITG